MLLFGVVCGGLILHGLLAWRLPAHVDELRVLADVYLAQDRQLASPILTFIAHLFAWAPSLGDTELDQLAWARRLQFLLQLGTVGMVYQVARTRFTVAASLLSVLACVSFSFVLHHGSSLRFDTPIAFASLAAVAVLLRSRQGGAGTPLALLLLALALLITIKTVLLLPMFAAIFVLRWRLAADRRSEAVALALGTLVAALFFGVAMQWHLGFVAGDALAAATRCGRSSTTRCRSSSWPVAGGSWPDRPLCNARDKASPFRGGPWRCRCCLCCSTATPTPTSM
jgi:hypothetical protein